MLSKPFMRNSKTQNEVIFLCYHYLNRKGEFERIWGYDVELFKKQIDFLVKEIPPIGFSDFRDFLDGKKELPYQKCSVLTFDDGLKEHTEVFAPYLTKKGIAGVFSLPTCIFANEMACPQIIHFSCAKYGIRNFYKKLKTISPEADIVWSDWFGINFEKAPLEDFYKNFKKTLLYIMDYEKTRRLLNLFFQKVLQKDCPNILDQVYLTEKSAQNLAKAGHTIAHHTFSHLSLSENFPLDNLWQKEITAPKQKLEKILGKEVDIFSYPYGLGKNSFNIELWKKNLQAAGFRFCFNAFQNFEGEKKFDPFWIERYSVQSSDTPQEIKKKSFAYQLS